MPGLEADQMEVSWTQELIRGLLTISHRQQLCCTAIPGKMDVAQISTHSRQRNDDTPKGENFLSKSDLINQVYKGHFQKCEGGVLPESRGAKRQPSLQCHPTIGVIAGKLPPCRVCRQFNRLQSLHLIPQYQFPACITWGSCQETCKVCLLKSQRSIASPFWRDYFNSELPKSKQPPSTLKGSISQETVAQNSINTS